VDSLETKKILEDKLDEIKSEYKKIIHQYAEKEIEAEFVKQVSLKGIWE
jgi:hypothetical protein